MYKSTFCLIIILIIGTCRSLLGQSPKIDQQDLQKLLQFSDSTGANRAMVIYNSKIIGSYNSTSCDSVYMNTASMVKSWTGLVIGILIDRGLINSEDDEICKYLPEWNSGCQNNITIKQLLTMSSGLQKVQPASKSILAQNDMNKFALQQKVTKQPGATFSYSNEGVQLLGILIENVSHQSAGAFFQQNLFTPLGMDSTGLWKDKSGNDIVYGGAQTTIQDASQIGLLMLNNGIYKGKRIVSEKWIRKSTSPSNSAAYYGYLWWLSPTQRNTPMENYAAMGDFGQLTIVFPKKNLIYLRQQSCKNSKPSKNMSWMGLDFIKMVGNVIKN